MTAIVTVRGEAQLETPPDRAGLSVTVHANADSAERTRAALAGASSAVAQVVEDNRSSLDRSSTSGIHVAPVFNSRSPARISGYSGTLATELSVVDFDALPALLVALTAIPHSQVDGPWWSLRHDHAGYRAARLAAIDDARVRAADYAAAFGGELTGLIEISDLDAGFGGSPRQLSRMAMAESGSDEPVFTFEPPTQTVSASVTVRFTVTGERLTP